MDNAISSSRVPWPIRAVVFDLDGLLVDTEPVFVEVARRVLAQRGQQICADVLHQMMGMPARDALQLFRAHHRLPDAVEDLAKECASLFFVVLGDKAAPLLPGAQELLDRLERSGVPKAIATSSRAEYVRRILQPHQLLDRFEFVLTADDVINGKPSPEVYVKAAKRFGCPASNMLVLEDSVNGLKAAKAAGAWCIVVPHALVQRDLLAQADAVLPSLADPLLGRLIGLALT